MANGGFSADVEHAACIYNYGCELVFTRLAVFALSRHTQVILRLCPNAQTAQGTTFLLASHTHSGSLTMQKERGKMILNLTEFVVYVHVFL